MHQTTVIEKEHNIWIPGDSVLGPRGQYFGYQEDIEMATSVPSGTTNILQV